MKKKVLIVSHFMEIGGAERALLGLLNGFDYQKYDVSLFLFRHEGGLMNLIPEEVNILPTIEEYTMLACPIASVIKEHHFLIATSRVFGKCASKVYNLIHRYGESSEVAIEYSHKFTKWCMPEIEPNKTFDLAISFLTPHYFVSEKVKAKKKIAWIHTDYSFVKINRKSEKKMWGVYDNIIAISKACEESFIKCFPTLKDKIIYMENLLAVDFMRIESKKEIPENVMSEEDCIKILSIGRFCKAKNFDNVPEICKRIIENGINIKWYIIGFGSDEELIRKQIKLFRMEDRVILLGKIENPYPYIKKCDWYIQPSRFEGKAVTVIEAQALHKPVIIANYLTAESQLKNGYDGMIVSQDNKSCADEISKIIKDSKLERKLIKNTYNNDYSNKKEIKKIYSLIEK